MTTMRKQLANKCALIGAGVGIVLYALFGLLQGALLGGTAGILLTNWVFGPGAMAVMSGDLITRAIIGGAMLAGVVISLVMFITITSVAGYICGSVLGMIAGTEEHEHENIAALKH